jgi:hypothetical protein
MKSIKIFIFMLLILSCKNDLSRDKIMETADYYVAVNGNDANPGTIDKPWATWQKAFSTASPGNKVFIRGGRYTKAVSVSNKKGTYSSPICIFNYPGETPILDLSTSGSSHGIYMNSCSYFYLKGLHIKGSRHSNSTASSDGFSFERVKGNRLENCVSYSNYGSGFFSYASDTLYFINCDSYDNFDELSSSYVGGQADGFVVCYIPQNGYTYYEGCRSWFNSDDGYDCWNNEGVVTFKNCWSFRNGRAEGDGCGFKLGETVLTPLSKPQRILTNCLSFNNKFIGFVQNEGKLNMTFYNNTSYHNGSYGYDIGEYSTQIIVRNCISYGNTPNNVSTNIIHDHNNWDSSPSITLSNADFSSIDTAGMSGARQENGGLPSTNFLKPSINSKLINRGISVGLPYIGSAPDIGAFEYVEDDTVVIPPAPIPILSVSLSEMYFPQGAGVQKFSITSNVYWTLSDNADWLTLSPSTGNNNNVIIVTTLSNNLNVSRSAIITISGVGLPDKTILVTQEPTSFLTPSLRVSNTNVTLDYRAGSLQVVTVTSNTTWIDKDNVGWLTVEPIGGTNNGTITIRAMGSNTSTINDRTAKVTVKSATITRIITVTQSKKPLI